MELQKPDSRDSKLQGSSLGLLGQYFSNQKLGYTVGVFEVGSVVQGPALQPGTESGEAFFGRNPPTPSSPDGN